MNSDEWRRTRRYQDAFVNTLAWARAALIKHVTPCTARALIGQGSCHFHVPTGDRPTARATPTSRKQIAVRQGVWRPEIIERESEKKKSHRGHFFFLFLFFNNQFHFHEPEEEAILTHCFTVTELRVWNSRVLTLYFLTFSGWVILLHTNPCVCVRRGFH